MTNKEEKIVNIAPEDDADYQESDVFLWANNLVQIKEDLLVELFYFNKNYVVYRAGRSKDLEMKIHQIFLDPLLEYVLEGIDVGLVVRGFEDAESEEHVLMRTRLRNVTKAKEILGWLRTQEAEIEQFVEEEHDVKRIKGVLVRVSHPELKKPFYVIKQLPGSNVMKGSASLMMRNGKLVPFDADAALRIPVENHLLILDDDIYVFNQAKLEQLFGYNAKKFAIAEQKAAEIEQNFKLSFLEGQNLNAMIKEKKPLINKLQKIEPTSVKQDELLSHAEELGIDIMTDDKGSILIADSKDVTKFVNLLNDDYYESPMTGLKYEIKSKKPLKLDDGGDDIPASPFAA